jgi:hypothetical protein
LTRWVFKKPASAPSTIDGGEGVEISSCERSALFSEDRMEFTKSIIAAGVLFSFGASLAYADNCTGLNVFVRQTYETTDLGNGHTITTLKHYSQIVSADSFKGGTTGECSGAVLVTPDGEWQTMGYCARRDKDGDTYSESWHKAPGADKGTWKLTGGTGKFAGKQGSGWWQSAWADGVMRANQWGGTCQ